jgi:YidC/Oxa1 family membrane protein insertase
MLVWDQFVDLLRAAIFAYSQACGGNVGTGIVTVTLFVRMAMLPLTLRLARMSAAHQETMRKLKRELDRIKSRFRDRPDRMAEETRRLFLREGVSPLPLGGCAGMLVQLPILLGLFTAVRRCAALGGRFLWIRNIAKPDFLLTAAVTSLTSATLIVGAHSSDQNRMLMAAVSAIITFIVLVTMPAGVGLYWGASGLVSLLQSALIRRARATN